MVCSPGEGGGFHACVSVDFGVGTERALYRGLGPFFFRGIPRWHPSAFSSCTVDEELFSPHGNLSFATCVSVGPEVTFDDPLIQRKNSYRKYRCDTPGGESAFSKWAEGSIDAYLASMVVHETKAFGVNRVPASPHPPILTSPRPHVPAPSATP